ncbi:MAG: SLC13 family permease [Desulfobulbus propionicus]|nr:MAG: SLC13 family permease [Desulfobulbus propionicus]
MPPVTIEMLIVFILLGVAVFLFVTDLLRVDLVGLLMMVALPLTGVVTPVQAVAGLSSNAVVSIIAVMILGAGLNRTGIMDVVAAKIIQVAGRSGNRIMVVVSATVAFISSFMQNIGAAALFLPATMRISRQLAIPTSRILMPMGFAAITGGCLTLVGASPLIMLNDLMEGWWQNNQAMVQGREFIPLELFSITPIGIVLLASVLFYFAVFGKWVLPETSCMVEEDTADKRLHDIYDGEVGLAWELVVPGDFAAQSLEELKLRPGYHMTVIAIAHAGTTKKDMAPMKDSVVGPGDTLAVICSERHVRRAAEELEWQLRSQHVVFSSQLSPDEAGVIEGVVVPHSNLSKHTMEELQFRQLYRVNPLAIVRGDTIIVDDINVTKLRQGDTLLLQGPWKQFRLLEKKMDIAFIEEIRGEETKPDRLKFALFFLMMSLIMALSFHVKLSIALLTGALGMMITRVIPADRAYEAVDWRTVFLLSGLIPLGTAFENTGAANWIAQTILGAIGQPPALLLLAVISLLSSFFALVASNVGAAVLMVPLAMNMAVQTGIDPMTSAMVVGMSASNTFILPTHQVNALIMRPGGYRTWDYMRAGAGVSVLYLVILVGMAWVFMPA